MSASLPLSSVGEGVPTRVEVDGHPVCVVRIADTVHAVDDTCTHAEVSLAEGELDGTTIECWLHGSRFDLLSGRPTGPPAVVPVTVHRVSVSDGTVTVALRGHDGAAPSDDISASRTSDERNPT
jgi:3-phenylpropionate/trans-cinnamate dioxygenase ferredoxin subunit